jgi:Skp family chaperone for outer membrane proteins
MIRPAILAMVYMSIIRSIAAADEDAVEKRLAAAKAEFVKSIDKARSGLVANLKKKAEAAQKNGDLTTLEKVEAEIKAFEDKGDLPKSVPTKGYEGELRIAKAKLEAAYASAVKEYTKAGQRAQAKAAQQELDKLKKGGGVAGAAPAEKVTKAFDGKTLAGWAKTKQATTNWSVDRGAIVGVGVGRPLAGCLVYSPQNLTDFTVRVKGIGTQDSAIMFRGSEHRGEYKGYSVSLSPDKQGKPAGTLFDFVPYRGSDVLAEAKKIEHKEGEAYEVEVRVKGSEITVFVDGQEVVRFKDDKRLYTFGGIALRCGKDSKLSVSKVELVIDTAQEK